MIKQHYATALGLLAAVLPTATWAATAEETLELTTKAIALIFALFVLAVIAAVYWMRTFDTRETPLGQMFKAGDPIHSVGPEARIAECARLMTANKVGALVVVEDGQLTGIFTERDALSRVLACGLDPNGIKVGEVMTKSPVCVTPTTTIGTAMELVTTRRFRHLPVVDNGRLVAVLSSGDLTRWFVKEKSPEAQQAVHLAAIT